MSSNLRFTFEMLLTVTGVRLDNCETKISWSIKESDFARLMSFPFSFRRERISMMMMTPFYPIPSHPAFGDVYVHLVSLPYKSFNYSISHAWSFQYPYRLSLTKPNLMISLLNKSLFALTRYKTNKPFAWDTSLETHRNTPKHSQVWAAARQT